MVTAIGSDGVKRDPLASPCNQTCRLDTVTGLCVGCFRTIDEIEAWPTATNTQKKMILELVAVRRGDLD
jgi:hypothetical protein